MEVFRKLEETYNQPPEYAGKDSFFGGEAPLSIEVGYLVVLGFGALFSIFTTLLVYLDKQFSGGKAITSEKFK
jgi:hypothetical protein